MIIYQLKWNELFNEKREELVPILSDDESKIYFEKVKI
jgi:hypothetical protein